MFVSNKCHALLINHQTIWRFQEQQQLQKITLIAVRIQVSRPLLKTTWINRSQTQERKSDETFLSGEAEHARWKSNNTAPEKTQCRNYPLTAQPWIFQALRELWRWIHAPIVKTTPENEDELNKAEFIWMGWIPECCASTVFLLLSPVMGFLGLNVGPFSTGATGWRKLLIHNFSHARPVSGEQHAQNV